MFPLRRDLHREKFKEKCDAELRELRREPHLKRLIDPRHNHVRLNTSVNRWGPPGLESQHTVIRLDENEFPDITISELWERSRMGQ